MARLQNTKTGTVVSVADDQVHRYSGWKQLKEGEEPEVFQDPAEPVDPPEPPEPTTSPVVTTTSVVTPEKEVGDSGDGAGVGRDGPDGGVDGGADDAGDNAARRRRGPAGRKNS